ncbi:hypothetical protein [Nostoc sp.]|uniref:hypothetical protein n=1 Tax=Nostoc sp. TaxID=1180 RepID=UPI002FF64469
MHIEFAVGEGQSAMMRSLAYCKMIFSALQRKRDDLATSKIPPLVPLSQELASIHPTVLQRQNFSTKF